MHRHRTIVASALGLALLTTPSVARAQQRPLVTEDPEVIGQGRILVEGGVTYGRDVFFPASGLRGNLVSVPALGVSVGLGGIVELQLDGALVNRLSITAREDAPLSDRLDVAGDRTSSVDDFVLATKVRLAGETAARPALGLRFATKLPNASNEKGLGLDTIDFYASLLVGKTVRSIRVVGNLGVGILSDPTDGTRQNDVLTLGASVARAVTDDFELVGELNGRIDTRAGEPPPGTEGRGVLRFGARFTRATVRIDAAMMTGLTVRDPSWGITLGATYVFDAFRTP
jgi:hypothetical protein